MDGNLTLGAAKAVRRTFYVGSGDESFSPVRNISELGNESFVYLGVVRNLSD